MKKKGQIGYTCGVFDLFHIGHLNLLRNAKGMCDCLIVGVSTDNLVMQTKRKLPLIPFKQRIEIVRNIKCVDIAIPQRSLDKLRAWRKLKFDRLFVGDDWYSRQKWKHYEDSLKLAGVKVIFFPYTKDTSSTKINELLKEKRTVVKR